MKRKVIDTSNITLYNHTYNNFVLLYVDILWRLEMKKIFILIVFLFFALSAFALPPWANETKTWGELKLTTLRAQAKYLGITQAELQTFNKGEALLSTRSPAQFYSTLSNWWFTQSAIIKKNAREGGISFEKLFLQTIELTKTQNSSLALQLSLAHRLVDLPPEPTGPAYKNETKTFAQLNLRTVPSIANYLNVPVSDFQTFVNTINFEELLAQSPAQFYGDCISFLEGLEKENPNFNAFLNPLDTVSPELAAIIRVARQIQSQ